MTLCIAAICQDEDEKERIVIGTDWRVEGGISAGADIQNKVYWVNRDMAVLVSGSVTRGKQLRDCFRDALAKITKKDPLTYINIRKFVSRGFTAFKRQLADDICMNSVKLTYQEFRHALSKHEIPETEASNVFKELNGCDLGCEVILVTFVDNTPFIFEIKKTGQWDDCDNFAIVGEGTWVAEAFLYLRKHESDHSVAETAYVVWEALSLAHRVVGSVGEDHTVNVIYPPGERTPHMSLDDLTDKGFAFMHEKFKDRFGIRNISRFPKLPKDALEIDDLEASESEPKPSTSQTPKPGQ